MVIILVLIDAKMSAGHGGVQKTGPPASKAVPSTRVINGLKYFMQTMSMNV